LHAQADNLSEPDEDDSHEAEVGAAVVEDTEVTPRANVRVGFHDPEPVDAAARGEREGEVGFKEPAIAVDGDSHTLENGTTAEVELGTDRHAHTQAETPIYDLARSSHGSVVS
jgi:chitodextrinase